MKTYLFHTLIRNESDRAKFGGTDTVLNKTGRVGVCFFVMLASASEKKRRTSWIMLGAQRVLKSALLEMFLGRDFEGRGC